MKTLTIFNDSITGYQVLYVDDNLRGEYDTVCGSDLVDASGGDPVRLVYREDEFPDSFQWPGSLIELERTLKVWAETEATE